MFWIFGINNLRLSYADRYLTRRCCFFLPGLWISHIFWATNQSYPFYSLPCCLRLWQAIVLVADGKTSLTVSGLGDVLSPHGGVIGEWADGESIRTRAMLMFRMLPILGRRTLQIVANIDVYPCRQHFFLHLLPVRVLCRSFKGFTHMAGLVPVAVHLFLVVGCRVVMNLMLIIRRTHPLRGPE